MEMLSRQIMLLHSINSFLRVKRKVNGLKASIQSLWTWPPKVTLRRLLPHARGLGFKPRCGGFLSGAKKEWGLSPKAKVRVLHTAELDVTNMSEAMDQLVNMEVETEIIEVVGLLLAMGHTKCCEDDSEG
nr:hypothetical protein [Tanacetum cinerariifolium]